MAIAIKAENISKQYRLGYVGSGSLKDDASRWWARMRGKEDPLLTVGETNDRSKKGESDYVWALKDINFEIEQGDTVGIIGRNGAGKSTLLKILSKVTAPTTGNIKVKGRIASLLEVGTGFHGELTGRENIYLNGAIMGMRKHEITRKLDEIVDFAGVERYLDTPVKRYSSGMYVRLGFAVAAHLENEILIVDEVLAVGDAEFQKKCLGRMKEVSINEGRTVLFVSHNIAAVNTLCNSGISLSNGTVAYIGNADETIQQYVYSSLSATNRASTIIFDGSEKERFGEQKYATIKSISLKNEEHKETLVFRMGEIMKIIIDLNIKIPSEDFEIGIAINNYQDVSLHYLVSTWEGFSKIDRSGETTIQVEVPKVLLFPGDYVISLWIAIRGAYYDDAVHSAIGFKVVEGKINSNNTYFERFSKNTQVYTTSNWIIK